MHSDRVTIEDWQERAAEARLRAPDSPAADNEVEVRRTPREPSCPAYLLREPDPYWDGRRRRARRRLAAAIGLVAIAVAAIAAPAWIYILTRGN